MFYVSFFIPWVPGSWSGPRWACWRGTGSPGWPDTPSHQTGSCPPSWSPDPRRAFFSHITTSTVRKSIDFCFKVQCFRIRSGTEFERISFFADPDPDFKNRIQIHPYYLLLFSSKCSNNKLNKSWKIKSVPVHNFQTLVHRYKGGLTRSVWEGSLISSLAMASSLAARTRVFSRSTDNSSSSLRYNNIQRSGEQDPHQRP